VQVQFLSQPFLDGDDLHSFVASVRADGSLTQLDVVVAWAKRSGLSRLSNDLAVIRGRASSTRLIVGIDEGGATRQGLELALDLFDQVYVFHDRNGRTFHPKLYLARGTDRARLLVGSHNLTAGGVYFNYEAGLDCHLELPTDAALTDAVEAYIDRLISDAGLCKQLSKDVLLELVANSRYGLRDEDAARRPSSGHPEDLDTEVDSDTSTGPVGAAPSMFGASSEPKRSDPMPRSNRSPRSVASHPSPATLTRARRAGRAGAGTPVVEKRWFKQLSPSDAQHPPKSNSKVTGALRLNQAGHPIDWRTYFRRDFFGDLNWHSEQSRNRKPLDYAMVPLRVEIGGGDVGEHVLRVDHAPHRESSQANVPTDIKWGPLMSALRAVDYSGSFVVVERLSDATFRLKITANDPGEGAFVA